jgi:hypothetical protein
LGESILEKLLKTPQTAQSLKEQTGADEKELMQLLSTLSKNKLIMRRKVTNPLIYYIRKKRELNQKS